ncbi:MAG TPA: class I SAM-dependent methyltransferase [Solirubrobacteraceae bacterium]|jgi:SAM-dependent methyltransferase
MRELARSFGSVAEAYERGRPRYEPHVIAAIGEAAVGPRILDVGAGTGRLSQPLTQAGYDVVAVEPLDGMRAILARNIGSERALDGRAEALPLDDASVGGAVSSDAWHWFDGDRAADELARVVRPGGGVVVATTYPMWADGGDAPHWWLDLRAVHAALPKADHPAFARGWRRPDSFDGHPAFADAENRRVPFVHHTDREGIVAHWASMSFVASLPDPQRTDFLGELDAMLARRGVEDVDIPYRAELWITRRRPGPALRAGRRAAAS